MKSIVTTTLFLLVGSMQLMAQCETWTNSPQKEQAEEAHVLYRQFMKSEDLDKAFPYWEKVFKMAPAADGQRSTHYLDGVLLYKAKWDKEADVAKKKEIAQIIKGLYDQQAQCYPNEASYAMGRKVYDMYYSFQSPYEEILKAAEVAIEKGGNSTEYIVFQPLAAVVVYDIANKKMDNLKARGIYEKLMAIADHNIANNKTLGTYYQQSKDAMASTFEPIERIIFDCDFFKKKYESQYRAKPDDTELIKEVYNKLTAAGCDAADPLVSELKTKYETLVEAENQRRLQAYYAENPGAHAKALYDDGKYGESLAKYKEAIAQTKESELLATYYYAIASMEYRKFDRYSSARENARSAAKYRSGWGAPYILIGDMYAASANSCGSDAFERGLVVLAAIEKYSYARSIDSSSENQSDASSKIGRYLQHRPDKEQSFMMGIKEGESRNTGCWIGESVTVRFK